MSDISSTQQSREPTHINPQLCVCMFKLLNPHVMNIYSNFIICSAQLSASNLLILSSSNAPTAAHLPLRVVPPRANEAEFEFNLRWEGIISFLVVMEMRCLSLTQWIVESDALMAWVQNSLTYIQTGVDRERDESWSSDSMPWVVFMLSCRIFWKVVVIKWWCVACECVCVCGIVGVFVFTCHVSGRQVHENYTMLLTK